MPELPDLEIVKEFLRGTVRGVSIQQVEIGDPLVLRCSIEKLTGGLEEKTIEEIRRRGKFLIFDLTGDGHLVLNLMLTGRIQRCPAVEKSRARLCLRIKLADGHELRYYDRKRMGRLYWLEGSDFSSVPQFSDLGPEATDPAVDLKTFRKRIRRHPGMIKNVLTNQCFLAGIGNAYADEILFEAGILPFRKRPSLNPDEVAALHRAIGSVLSWAQEELRERVGSEIHVEIRDFLRVHGKGGQACPLCGNQISEVVPNRRRTNFCRVCQR
jgi:formamidopyrimidine-DNA glycosylase